MREEIERFFGGYRDAYNRADAVAVARHIAAPSILLEREATIWSTDDQVLQAMEQLVSFYRKNGFEAASFTLDRLWMQGKDDAVADVAWTIDRSEGRAPWRFHTGYNLRRLDGAWRIVCCTAYEEPQARQHGG